MFQRLPHTAQAVSFIGAGLAMVAYGASTAVGLAEENAAVHRSSDCAQPEPIVAPSEDIDQCIGRRLDVYAHLGC